MNTTKLLFYLQVIYLNNNDGNKKEVRLCVEKKSYKRVEVTQSTLSKKKVRGDRDEVTLITGSPGYVSRFYEDILNPD